MSLSRDLPLLACLWQGTRVVFLINAHSGWQVMLTEDKNKTIGDGGIIKDGKLWPKMT